MPSNSNLLVKLTHLKRMFPGNFDEDVCFECPLGVIGPYNFSMEAGNLCCFLSFSPSRQWRMFFRAIPIRTGSMSMPVIPDDVGLSVPYTVDELMAIVDVHNQERGNVTPSAADMEYMVRSIEVVL